MRYNKQAVGPSDPAASLSRVTREDLLRGICTPRKADFGQMIILVPLLNLYAITSQDGG